MLAINFVDSIITEMYMSQFFDFNGAALSPVVVPDLAQGAPTWDDKLARLLDEDLEAEFGAPLADHFFDLTPATILAVVEAAPQVSPAASTPMGQVGPMMAMAPAKVPRYGEIIPGQDDTSLPMCPPGGRRFFDMWAREGATMHKPYPDKDYTWARITWDVNGKRAAWGYDISERRQDDGFLISQEELEERKKRTKKQKSVKRRKVS